MTSEVSITDDRYKKYFANALFLYNEYNSICDSLDLRNDINIGLILGEDDYEYPLFCQFYGKHINPVHINVSNNVSMNIPVPADTIDFIISTTTKEAALSYGGKQYFNQTAENKKIWLYK